MYKTNAGIASLCVISSPTAGYIPGNKESDSKRHGNRITAALFTSKCYQVARCSPQTSGFQKMRCTLQYGPLRCQKNEILPCSATLMNLEYHAYESKVRERQIKSDATYTWNKAIQKLCKIEQTHQTRKTKFWFTNG